MTPSKNFWQELNSIEIKNIKSLRSLTKKILAEFDGYFKEFAIYCRPQEKIFWQEQVG